MEEKETTPSSEFPQVLSPSSLLLASHNNNNNAAENSNKGDPTKLVWDFTKKSFLSTSHDNGGNKVEQGISIDDGDVRIYLGIPSEDQEEEKKEGGNSGKKEIETTATTTTTTLSTPSSVTISNAGPPEDTYASTTTTTTTNNNHDDEIIEESVLQYQRQLRKTRAAKKAGATLHPDQLEIVYQDDKIVVVNKPSGVLTVPGIHNNDSIANFLFSRIQKQPQQPQQQQQQGEGEEEDNNSNNVKDDHHDDDDQCQDPTSMTVHRLDMDTSGLVVFGNTKTAVSTLHQVFRRDHDNTNTNNNNKQKKRNRKRKKNNSLPQNNNSNNMPSSSSSSSGTTTVTKEYEALVCGHLPEHISSGHINLPLQRDVHHPPFMRVSTPSYEKLARQVVDELRQRNWTNLSKRNPKSSQTLFRVLGREYYNKNKNKNNNNDNLLPVTRLSLTPITGRTHQLRVHCAAIGFPIVGDPVYGLYGESAFCGGLYQNPVQIILNNNNATATNNIDSDYKSRLEKCCWRAPISLQKEIMNVHHGEENNDNTKDMPMMCLHAKRLGFPHPTTGIEMEWHVPPKF